MVQNSWVGARQRRRAAQRAAAAVATEGDASSSATIVPSSPSAEDTNAAAASSNPLFKLLLQSRRAADFPASPDAGGAEPITRGPGLVIKLFDVEDRQTAQQFVALFKKRLSDAVAKA